MARLGGERPLHSLPLSPPATNGVGAASPTRSPGSPMDSRIPRLTPSPQALRRSASLRLRGASANLASAGAAASPSPSSHHHHHHYHHHRAQDIFPAIVENGNETPKRSVSSLSLSPLKGRARPSAGCSDDCSDAESVKSYGSNYSTASACDHASFALNGTTWSGRSKRYVVHCSTHQAHDGDEYLTPTQRAARQVRRFQGLLREARKEIEEKDREILRLTKELVELRLYKASLNSPEDKTDSSDAPTVRENNPFSPQSPSKEPNQWPGPQQPSLEREPDQWPGQSLLPPEEPEPEQLPLPLDKEASSSLVDSGHFDDGSVHSKPGSASHDDSIRSKIVQHYEGRIEEMHRRHVDEIQLLKQNQNDKVEGLLNQLSELSTRYYDTRPSLDLAEARVKELEQELEALRTELSHQKALLADQEERNKQMYLKMYSKGQEAARIEHADQVLEQAQKNPSKVSVAELLQQLTVTQAELENVKPFEDSSFSSQPIALAHRSQSLLSVQEAVSLWVLGARKVMYRRILEAKNAKGALDPEITLQFLKSAVYYFLTDKENLQGHLNAIESILGFTESEKLNIDRIYGTTRK